MKKSPAKKKTRVSPLTRVVILVLLAALGWQLYGLRAQTERDQYAAQVAEQKRENAALEADIAEGPTEEKLQEIARDELGLVKPGEYVFEPGG